MSDSFESTWAEQPTATELIVTERATATVTDPDLVESSKLTSR